MTSSFSNLVLAGLVLAQPEAMDTAVPELSQSAISLLPSIDQSCRRSAVRMNNRLVVLSSSPFRGWAHEAALKILEMTAGHFSVLAS